MSFEQKFDNIVRRKFEQAESEFPFDEKDWEKASKLIEAERATSNVRNSKLFLFYGAMILLMGTAGFFAFKYLSGDNITETANANSGSKPVIMGAVQVEANNITTEKNIVAAENISEVNVVKSEEENISGNSSSKKSGIKQSQKDNSNAGKNKEQGEKNISDISLNEVAAKKSDELNDVSKINERETVSEKKGVANDKSVNLNNNKKGSRSDKGSANVYNSTKATNSNVSKTTKTIPEPLPLVNNETVYSDVYTNTGNSFWLAGKVTALPVTALDSGLRKTAYDFIRIYEDDYFKTKRRKSHYMNIEAGTAYLFGWDVPKGKDAKGFNAFFGMNYGLHISKKVSVNTGAQVYNIGNIQQPFYTGSNVTYDFGANGTYTNIASNCMYYAAVPLKINYAVTGRNRIGLGVNTGFLFNAINTVETFTMQDGSKINVQKDRVTGYYEGINPINVMLTASYSHSVGKRIRFNGEFVYGLSDIYKNTDMNSIRENNMGVRLSLQYTLFDR